ncbi:protein tramtrack, beta isoform isoform X3 [Chelonus insularis]|uniref:protein tramtrack, beta isoform isoform X3 n=1 Tax=Chelonus insularis TaxID=460826 RepID=UPI0015882CB4|nr:protein tramtrack, beta isoform isoform X3 [Chelonus insularis]
MEDDQQFCLRWNNHQTTLIQNFDTLLESGTLVDCTLAAEGKYLKAHKVVLSACSPYFEGLLSEHYDKHPVFILKDVKFKELKAMMDYMYRGEVNISQDQLAALLKAAESLQIKGLSESKTGGSGSTSNKTDSRQQKVPQPTAPSLDIPHASSGLTIEKNKVPRQSLAQTSVGDLPEDSASPQLPKGISSREGSQSPTARKRKRLRRRSLGDDNPIENHETSNSSDMPHQQMSVPALGVAPVADEKSHADPTDSLGRSALMQQLTKPADEMLQMPVEKPEPNDSLIEPKSEYLEDPEESVEDLTLDDDMNDLNEMEQDNNRAGPSHDPSQHPGLAAWHVTGDRSNAGGVVSSVAGAPGATDEVFLAAQEAAQAHRDSQERTYSSTNWTISTLPSTSKEFNTRRLRSTTFGDDSYLMRNRVRRLGSRKYLCMNCGSTFALKASLTRHQSLECERNNLIGKKPQVTKSLMKSDRNSVPKLKSTTNFVPILPKITNVFSAEALSSSHSSRPDAKKKKFVCKQCGRCYAFYTSLWRHLNYECGKEPQFNCDFCPVRFAQKSNLERHIRNMHSTMNQTVG